MQPREIASYYGDVILSSSPPEMSIFTDDERAILIEMNTKFEDYTSKKNSLKSHDEKGYQETSNGELIPYSYAMHLKV
jgi:hypothetical protein